MGGNPIGICSFAVYTDTFGNFRLEAPAGSYNLVANATGYNASIPLPVTLHPGQVIPIGTLFLERSGTGEGAVISSSTLLPIANASVFPCASWSGGGCLPTIQTSTGGTFALYGPPGPYTVTVASPGYVVAYASVLLKAGVLSLLQPIKLDPLGTATFYTVSGEVLNASNPTQGLSGATLIAEVNGTPAYTGVTNTQGLFSFQVLYGTYDLVATDPGFAPSNRTVIVNGPITVDFSLSVMTFLFSSSVTDGLTGTALAGVEDLRGLGTARRDRYRGSGLVPPGERHPHPRGTGPRTTEYAPVVFAVPITGGPVVHNLQMEPPSSVVHGVIVDSISGVPLAGVTVVIHGITVDGVPIAQTETSNGQGAFSLTLTQGSYNASASTTGYTSRVVAFTVAPPGGGLAIPLTPVAPPHSSQVAPSGNNVQWTLVAIVGLVVVAAVLGTLLLAGRRPPRAAPRGRAARPPAGKP